MIQSINEIAKAAKEISKRISKTFGFKD